MAGLMFADSLVEAGSRDADTVGFVGATKHVDINLHLHRGSSPFDRLRVRVDP
jgi:hypothetical protein